MANDIIQNPTPPPNTIVYICSHYIMPCAVAIGIIGNLLSILVFARREMIKFCVSIFTIALALSDILLLTTSLFNIILPEFPGGVPSDKSAFWCHFHGYFDLLFAALSGYSVVFISVERWFSVWKPFDKAKYVTSKTTLTTVISYTCISSLLFLWFPLTLDYNANPAKSRERCSLKWETVYKICGTLSVIFTYIVPFISLGILNILIVYRLHTRQQTSIQRSMISTSSSSTTDASLITTSTRKRQQRQKNTDRNITLMLITVAIAFMVMSFPYQIYWFHMQIHQVTAHHKTLFMLTQTFRYLNCCCNFFLYSATSSLFRRELREMFQCYDRKVQRARTLSISLSHNPNKEKSFTEQQNLLRTMTATQPLSTKTTMENLHATDANNGHSVTFKT